MILFQLILGLSMDSANLPPFLTQSPHLYPFSANPINLGFNSITSLPSNVFDGLSSLNSLQISISSFHISFSSSSLFDNSLSSLHPSIFTGLTSLISLEKPFPFSSLSHLISHEKPFNHTSFWHLFQSTKSFIPLQHLFHLNDHSYHPPNAINKNRLTSIPLGAFEGLENLVTLSSFLFLLSSSKLFEISHQILFHTFILMCFLVS